MEVQMFEWGLMVEHMFVQMLEWGLMDVQMLKWSLMHRCLNGV